MSRKLRLVFLMKCFKLGLQVAGFAIAFLKLLLAQSKRVAHFSQFFH